MRRYLIGPEVAGQLGNDTILNYSTKPPIIEKLHYRFDDWLGDDFLEGFQCFICTERLANYLNENKLTGYKLEDCKISKSELFDDLNEDGLDLPIFYWFKVIGNENEDFFIIPNSRLIISERALNILKMFNINHCDIKEYSE
ncbi:hypothetical protein HDF18_15190 [Mucilaginibacter sp. X5P1]|uniref:hypothetical protein n=1 Tax=Mucilaginibacter sp. X5P1 TaxID=2723088 RepID=UPI00161C1EB3|nr:hypothetical protein [Mucilaginibacter sp. X5P1]MBB6138955.1 hypothetical protein [Mucilaginibacter sp. X5P1]